MQLRDKERAYELTVSVVTRGDAGQDEDRENLVWIRDVSEQKRKERFQREMLSTTTHDLKGPLGAVLTGAELLQDMLPEEEKPHQIALRVASSTQGVLNMIEEFLSARRIESGSFILHPKVTELSEIFSSLEQTHATIAKARSIELVFDYPEESRTVEVDKLAIERVFGNLLSNALKFTPKNGRVTVSAKLLKESWLVEVRDTGPGMEAAEAKRIFERFTRLEKHHEVAGSGIGLYIVKSLVEAHGGSIEVFSQPGEGTAFRVSIPFDLPKNEHGELISLEFA